MASLPSAESPRGAGGTPQAKQLPPDWSPKQQIKRLGVDLENRRGSARSQTSGAAVQHLGDDGEEPLRKDRAGSTIVTRKSASASASEAEQETSVGPGVLLVDGA